MPITILQKQILIFKSVTNTFFSFAFSKQLIIRIIAKYIFQHCNEQCLLYLVSRAQDTCRIPECVHSFFAITPHHHVRAPHITYSVTGSSWSPR